MEMYRETSESRQHDATNLQQGSLTVQKQSNTFSKKIQEQQATTNNSKNRWDHNSDRHNMGLFIYSKLPAKIFILIAILTLCVPFYGIDFSQKNFKIPSIKQPIFNFFKYISKIKFFPFGYFLIFSVVLFEKRPDLSPQASEPNCIMDDDLECGETMSIGDKRVLETKLLQDHQSIVWSINHGSQGSGQKRDDQESMEKQSISFLPRFMYGEEAGNMGHWELRGSEPVDAPNSGEARYPIESPLNLCEIEKSSTSLSKLPALLSLLKNDRFGFHIITSKKDLSDLSDLLYEDNIKYFAKTFGIIDPRAVCIDHSGLSIWILDNHGHMFCWDEMGHNMDYMGSSLIEGLTNNFFNPDKIYRVTEDTCELNRWVDDETLWP
ncbi:uncharacterized protein OCT59_024635 [Rhizophagus irregularis]|uniref:Uncharacterized protein n=1 Tax=Rhizophagus irregularis (strain DAOM 197198w) TaxID=1432141 RepID=A0A015L8U3_RHIIW|nr:hypothetical protein RirG_100400 [Rhizophagus irregularis DAOM 197198w]UZO04244.1 hypothetical protein OCT59_024635 [Rhizophagus irregularis]GBC19308.2 hypothetical protein GLOIN_2v1776484 [Rhizophagus irregularis DAOM 181602=DAOM 197198]